MLAIYTRLSKEDEASNSINNQLREGKEFAQNNNYTTYKVYDEGEGISGTLALDDRPQLLQLMADVKSGLISSIWMRNANRLDRNTGVFYLFVDEVKKANVSVYFGSNDKLDYNDPTTLLQSTIISSLNQYQAQLQSLQTKKALADNIKEGKAWGVLPYGYMTDNDKKLIVNEGEIKVINEVFELSLKGWGVQRIATFLNDKNVSTKYNSYEGDISIKNKYDKSVTTKSKKDIKWSAKTVLDMLKCSWYIGYRVYKENEYPTPQIIDKELFEKVQLNLKTNVKNSGKKVEYRYLLKGLLRCHKCGRNYYGRTRLSKKDNHYMCSSKRVKALNCGSKAINIPAIESFIVKHLFNDYELFKHLENINNNDNAVKELEKEKESVEELLKKEREVNQRLFNLLLNPALGNDEQFIKQYNQSKANISTYEACIQAIERRLNERVNKTYINQYKSNLEVVNTSNFTQLKEAVNDIIEFIKIYSDYDVKNKVYYLLEVKYKGIDEVCIYSTSPPYKKWYWLNKNYVEPTNEDIQEEKELFEYLLKRKPTNEEFESFKNDSYNTGYNGVIELSKGDLIEFN